jgi:hypothetical protein
MVQEIDDVLMPGYSRNGPVEVGYASQKNSTEIPRLEFWL